MATLSSRVWETANGTQIPFDEVTHEHWSNIYWYHRYILERSFSEIEINKCERLMGIALIQIEHKFNGKLLDWIPIYDNEKRWFKGQCTRKVLIEKHKETWYSTFEPA
ncbi:MAG TPA: hypothetical protein VNX68_06010 [Nitrosopumilaceae archaeon]|jgi:hypothetical protein|nr:hypothetical protein [Nitrosopumilaceae archaeon]